MPGLVAVANYLLKAFATDPKGVLKIVFWILVIPIILISTVVLAPLGIFSHVPMVKTGQHEIYKNVVNQINSEKGVLIDWKYLIGIDAVLFEQDFSQVEKAHVESIANRFIESYKETEERKVEVPCLPKLEDCSIEPCEKSFSPTPTQKTEKCYEIEEIEVTRYRLKTLETVLEEMVTDNTITSEEIEHIKRYIQFVGTDETQVNLEELPIITDGKFMRPATGVISSGYGPRWGTLHAGIDIGGGGRSGVPIVSVADGVVRKSYYSSTYGEVVMITHNINGEIFESVYAHMVEGSRLHRVGQYVKKGDVIGIMGSTGDSDGVHLHFELHMGLWNVNKTNAVNPIYHINFR